jgi:DNA-binding transcriptional MerR regulator
MTRTNKSSVSAVQLFEPDPDVVYTIEAAGQIAHTPRRTILIYCRHGLVSSVTNPAREGYYFDLDAIRTLRRIAFLRADCGVNFVGIKLILRLLNEMERVQPTPIRVHQPAPGTNFSNTSKNRRQT